MAWLKKGTTETLTETVLTEAADCLVKESEGVIEGVRIINRNSENHGGNREYTDQAIEDGIRLYEGAEVNIDHPPNGQEAKPRAFTEGWGVLRNVRRSPDRQGDIGDLHYLKEHAATPLILERHKRGFPLGLSHNALGKTVNRNGRQFVESLQKVHSVDLVRRPATTKSLKEGVEDDPTLAEFVETLAGVESEFVSLLEGIAAAPAMAAMPVPMGDAKDQDNQIRAAMLAIVNQKIEGADKAVLAKVLKVLGIEDSITGNSVADAANEEAMKEELEKLTEAVKTLTEQNEATAKELAELKHRDLVRSVMESHQLTPAIGAERIKALTEALDEAAMKTLIESWPPAVRRATPPNFKAATALTEQVAATPKSTGGVRQLLRSR